jgi:hypothetical protein
MKPTSHLWGLRRRITEQWFWLLYKQGHVSLGNALRLTRYWFQRNVPGDMPEEWREQV